MKIEIQSIVIQSSPLLRAVGFDTELFTYNH